MKQVAIMLYSDITNNNYSEINCNFNNEQDIFKIMKEEYL
jgi:hypothetical protein